MQFSMGRLQMSGVEMNEMYILVKQKIVSFTPNFMN